MKKLLAFLVVVSGLVLAHHVQAEQIDNYEVQIKMSANNLIDITERVDYNFGDIEKHGISRYIPYIYGSFFSARHSNISNISVRDENNQAYNFIVSKEGNKKLIKIGDAGKLITGAHTYIINYQVDNPYIFDKDQDQLYWDAIGSAWNVPIAKSRVEVDLPQVIANNSVQAFCYQGSYKSDKPCSVISYLFDNNDTGRVRGVIFRQDSQLFVGQGLTILVKIPKGYLLEPSREQKFINFFKNNGIILLPLIIFVVMFNLWYRRGRDPKGRGTIIVQYDVPDKLAPAEVGAIVDEKVQRRDVSAEIIYLAIQGYLKITRLPKKNVLGKDDYLLEQFKDEKDLLKEHHKELLANIFAKPSLEKDLKKYQLDTKTKKAVLLSDINDAYKWRGIVEDKAYQAVVDGGYFLKSPNKIRSIYIGGTIAAVLLFNLLFWPILSGENISDLTFISIGLSTLIIVVFGLFMPRRTQKGVLTKEYILGLREYLSVAEKDRLKFHNAPAKNPQHFEALLPYAMVLGVEKQWAKQFEGIYNNNPTWCAGFYAGTFNIQDFSSGLNSFDSRAADTFSPPSGGAGGGGFVGGGGGGGGGGSW